MAYAVGVFEGDEDEARALLWIALDLLASLGVAARAVGQVRKRSSPAAVTLACGSSASGQPT